MGKIKLFGLVMGVATMAMAQNPSTSTKSRELSATTPVSGYFLSTDGILNRWTLVNNLASGTAMTVTKKTGAVTVSGTNNLVTPTATITKQVGSITLSITPQYGIPTDAPMTNVLITVIGGNAVMTNATCAITPDLASNAVVAVTVTGGSAVMTNVTVAVP